MLLRRGRGTQLYYVFFLELALVRKPFAFLIKLGKQLELFSSNLLSVGGSIPIAFASFFWQMFGERGSSVTFPIPLGGFVYPDDFCHFSLGHLQVQASSPHMVTDGPELLRVSPGNWLFGV